VTMAFQRKKPAPIGAKALLPGFIEPALATAAECVPNGDRWIHEIKFDGYRVQVHLANTEIKVFTRRGHDCGRIVSRRSPQMHGTSQRAPRLSTAKSLCRRPTAAPTFRFSKMS
jgi:ATP dependent DNA ligase-like protein